MAEGNIEVALDDTNVVQGEPSVLAPNFIVIKGRGQVLGRVPATFDFSELPEEWHAMALRIISGAGMTVYAGSLLEPDPEPRPPKPKGLWDRIRGRLNRVR